MRAHGVSRLVFSSTCATYGYPDQVPVTEDEPKKPESPYGESKLTFERVLASYARAYDLRSVSLRYFNAAGARPDGTLGEDHEPETHLIPLVLRVAAGLAPSIKVFGTDYPTPDGTCIRDYIHVDDLASAHILALDAMDEPGACKAFNLGTGRGYSVREIVEACRRVTGREIPVEEVERRPGDPAALYADNSKIRRELGWSPAVRRRRVDRGDGLAVARAPVGRPVLTTRPASARSARRRARAWRAMMEPLWSDVR